MRTWVVWIVMLAACHEQPGQRAEEICAAFCDCVEPTKPTCIDNDCLPALEQTQIDPCFSCVTQYEAACTNLETQCANVCFQTQTPIIGGSP